METKLENKIDREALLHRVKTLSAEVASVNLEKAASLEAALGHESECYAWRREQMIAIHQMKYRFSQEMLKLHQEFRKLNQETRCQIERLRCGEPLECPEVESPVVDNTQSASDAL